MCRSWLFLLLLFTFLMVACTAPTFPATEQVVPPTAVPVSDQKSTDAVVTVSEPLSSKGLNADPADYPNGFGEMVYFNNPPSAATLSMNTGYCPPGDTRQVEGMWYRCGGITISEWKRIDPRYIRPEEDVYALFGSGETVGLYSAALFFTTIDPIPLDELIVYALGSTLIVAVSQNAINNMDLQPPPPPIWTGTTAAEYDSWKAGAVSTAIHDEVGINVNVDSLVHSRDFVRTVPKGIYTAIVIEDSPIWAAHIVAALTAGGIRTVAVYPHCPAWRAGPIKNANVFVVDFHNDLGVWGPTCIPEIQAQVPMPIVVAGFTAERLHEPREELDHSSVQEMYDEAGADFVVRKGGQGIELARLVEGIINFLLGI